MNATDRKSYWAGYRSMKALAVNLWSADKAFQSIYNSNHGNAYVSGARRAYEYVKRVGLANVNL